MMSREDDAAFAAKVLGKKTIYLPWSETNWYMMPGGEWWQDAGKYPEGQKIRRLPRWGRERARVPEMIEGIEKLCGGTVLLRRENGTYCAMADCFIDAQHREFKNYGDGTPNGALLALGLAIADSVQKLHGGWND
jgi:hypothetical protein